MPPFRRWPREPRNPIWALALLPGLYWNGGVDSAQELRSAGIQQLYVAPPSADAWNKQGLSAKPLSDEALRERIKLKNPGIDLQVAVASATRAPWVNANGWRMRRDSGRDFWYDLLAGAAPLAAAEAYAYGAKAVLKIDHSDVEAYGRMLQFLGSIPERTFPDVADFAFIDDGSPSSGELLNLLSRRNLLYKIVRAPDPHLRLNVAPKAEDPYVFAEEVRDRLTDDARSLRVYGAEVVLCRFTANESGARLHLLNYGRNKLGALRLRLRGQYARGELLATGSAKKLEDYRVSKGFTEFSVPELVVYAVVDLTP